MPRLTAAGFPAFPKSKNTKGRTPIEKHIPVFVSPPSWPSLNHLNCFYRQLPVVMVRDLLDHVLSWFLNALQISSFTSWYVRRQEATLRSPRKNGRAAHTCIRPVSRVGSNDFSPEKKGPTSNQEVRPFTWLLPHEHLDVDATAPLLRRCPMDSIVNSITRVLQNPYSQPDRFVPNLNTTAPQSRELRGTSMSV